MLKPKLKKKHHDRQAAANCSGPHETAKVEFPDERGPLDPEQLRKINAYWRAANYLAVGQIYLCDNFSPESR